MEHTFKRDGQRERLTDVHIALLKHRISFFKNWFLDILIGLFFLVHTMSPLLIIGGKARQVSNDANEFFVSSER